MTNYYNSPCVRTTRGAVPHMVCFDCRVAFKDITECPHCRQPLINLGTRFKSPRRNNIREWKRVELMHLAQARTYSHRYAATVRDAKHMLDQAWRNNPIDRWRRQGS